MAVAPALPAPKPANPTPPTVSWADKVEEIDRLARIDQLARYMARGGPSAPAQPPPRPPPLPPPLPPPTGSDPNAVNFVPPVGIYDKRPKTAAKTNPPSPKTQSPKPYGGVSYAAAARAVPKETNEWTKVPTRRRGAGQQATTQQPQAPKPVTGLNLDQRKFVFIRECTCRREYHTADIMSAVNRALHQEAVPTYIRMFQLRRNNKGTLAGLSTPFAPIDQLLAHRNSILRAALTIDPTVIDITAKETRRRVKIHGVPLNRYLGKGTHGLEKLREEIEAENEGVEIPMQIRWHGRIPDIK